MTRLPALLRLAAVLLLAACQMSLPGSGPTRMALFGGAVTVAAPFGYCVNPASARIAEDSAVVLIGRCKDGSEADAALVTVSVGGPGSAAVLAAGGQGLADFFTSGPGRATLARSGRAGDVRILRAVTSGEDFLMLLADRSAGPYWRAVIGLRGRLVTVAAAGTEQVPLTAEKARRILDATLSALRAANPGT